MLDLNMNMLDLSEHLSRHLTIQVSYFNQLNLLNINLRLSILSTQPTVIQKTDVSFHNKLHLILPYCCISILKICQSVCVCVCIVYQFVYVCLLLCLLLVHFYYLYSQLAIYNIYIYIYIYIKKDSSILFPHSIWIPPFYLFQILRFCLKLHQPRYAILTQLFFLAFHGCSNHSNLEMETECLTKTLSHLKLNISRTKNGRNKL